METLLRHLLHVFRDLCRVPTEAVWRISEDLTPKAPLRANHHNGPSHLDSLPGKEFPGPSKAAPEGVRTAIASCGSLVPAPARFCPPPVSADEPIFPSR